MSGPESVSCQLGGQLTIYEVGELRERLVKQLELHEELVLEAGELREVDSAGLQLLVHVAREARRLHRTVWLHQPSAALQELVELMRVQDQLPEVRA